MKTRIRFHAAAAMLLLPLGAALVAEPAAAQQRGFVVAQAQLIERFVMRPMGRLHAGEEVRFRVSGAPGGQAWVDVPGVVSGVRLQETRPGVYEGTYTVRRRDNLEAFDDAVASVQRGQQRATARVEVRGNQRDGDRAGRDDRRDDREVNERRAREERELNERRAREARELDERRTREERERLARVTPGPLAALPLEVTSHTEQGGVNVLLPQVVRGRTVPHAMVRVQADARYTQALNASTPLLDQTVRADANGNFAVQVPPMRVQAYLPTQLELRITATSGPAVGTHQVTLQNRS
jgi:hypothetical protein